MRRDPLARHASSPAELRDRLAAERRGTPFLLYSDGDDRQVIVEVSDDRTFDVSPAARTPAA